MRRLVTFLLLATVLIAISSCGSSSNSSSFDPAQSFSAGNWLLVATSATPGSNSTRQYTFLRGAVHPSGNAISATMGVASRSLTCYQNAPATFSGSLDQTGITLTSASVGGSAMTITGNVAGSTNISGTYTSTVGSYCQTEDSGAVYGMYIPPITGAWTGTFTSANQGAVNATASITQGPANSSGIFPLSGTVIFQNYSCFTSGVIDSSSSYIQGENVTITARGANGSQITFGTYLPNPNTPTSMDGGTTPYHVYYGSCGYDYGNQISLTKS